MTRHSCAGKPAHVVTPSIIGTRTPKPSLGIFEDRLAKAAELRALYPGYSSCHRCGLPWPCCEEHTTNHDERRGCFPLCVDCWRELRTPEARLPFYRELCAEWSAAGYPDPERDARIFAAVLAGG